MAEDARWSTLERQTLPIRGIASGRNLRILLILSPAGGRYRRYLCARSDGLQGTAGAGTADTAIFSDRETSVRTCCLALLLCTVCGTSLHAGDRRALDAPATVIAWWPSDPDAVLKPTDGGPWASKLQVAIPCNCGPDSSLLLIDDPSSDTPFGFKHDVRGFLPGVWRDARGIVRSENMLILGVALAASIGIRQDLDDEVREDVARHPQRWGDMSRALGHLGEAPYQVPVLGLVWGLGIWNNDPVLNDFSHALVSAYTINGLAVLAIKGVADTDRPDPDWNGGRWGFPSFHAASAFTIAGVLDDFYGWPAAVPAYTLAGLISWSRIDERDHDLSDVVFGATMGWVIGKSVAGTHLRNDGRVMLMPWSHPYERANGVALEVRY